jgi:hypothetical protein
LVNSAGLADFLLAKPLGELAVGAIAKQIRQPDCRRIIFAAWK